MKKLKLLILLLLSLTGIQKVWADIEVIEFVESRRNTAQHQFVIDDEGQYCALIKLKTDVKGIVIEAAQPRTKKGEDAEQGIYLVEPQCEAHTDEIWIYLTAKTKRFRLYHPDYGGMKEESEGVKNGYYYLADGLHPELIYLMEIRCDSTKTTMATSPALLASPTLVDARFDIDNPTVPMYLDRSRVQSGKPYLLPAGEHTFKTRHAFYRNVRQKVVAREGQPVEISVAPQRYPAYLLGGIEVGKPSSYSNWAYGVRAGIVCHVGLYASYLTTMGTSADGDAIQPQYMIYQPSMPYRDPQCDYHQWNVGLLLHCCSPLFVYAGVGQGIRTVTWQGDDGKRHELLSDRSEGFSLEAGVMVAMKRFYLSAGTDCLDGKWGSRIGVGMFFNLLK